MLMTPKPECPSSLKAGEEVILHAGESTYGQKGLIYVIENCGQIDLQVRYDVNDQTPKYNLRPGHQIFMAGNVVNIKNTMAENKTVHDGLFTFYAIVARPS